MNDLPPQRVSPIQSPERYDLPSRPADGAPALLDAFRQTQFVLGDDLALFAEAQNLLLALVKDAYPSKYRTHALASVLGLASRVYGYLTDALLLTTRGSYASTPPLVRAAVEALAAEVALCGPDGVEYTRYLLANLRPHEELKAFELGLGRFYAGEVIAAEPLLRGVYRPAADLARPHFGATLLQVGPESNRERLALAFADPSFHLGWAELALGWLLALSARQLRVLVDADAVFPITDERRAAYDDLQRRIDAALTRDDRARIEEIEHEGDRRYLVHNFRRRAGGAAKKLVL